MSEAASSEWPVSTRARSESTWSDSRKSIEPDPKKSGKPDSQKSVRPRERTQFPSDVQDILESSLNTGEVSIDETFTEVTVRIGSLINASTFVVAQLPAGTSQPGERAYEVMSYLDFARFLRGLIIFVFTSEHSGDQRLRNPDLVKKSPVTFMFCLLKMRLFC